MRITERKLRRIIRQVINENTSDPRLSVDFGMKIERILDDVKDDFVNQLRMYGNFSEDQLSDYSVDNFIREYLREVMNLEGEENARRRFSGNYNDAIKYFEDYINQGRHEYKLGR